MMVDPSNVEGWHWIKSSKNPKKVIVRLYTFIKKGLKGMNLSSFGINTMVYINNSLCTYYKMQNVVQ